MYRSDGVSDGGLWVWRASETPVAGPREDWGESQAMGCGGLELGLTGAELHVDYETGRVWDPLEDLSAVSSE